MAQLLDYSQLLIAAGTSQPDEMKRGNDPKMIRQVILNSFFRSILYYNRTYRGQYGAPIVCVDSKNVWRKKVFAHYKAHRQKNKDDSTMDWGVILSTMDEVRDVLDKYFPWKVVKVEGAEGDDIIACLTKYFQDNEEKDHGLFTMPQDILIVSSDGDFGQLRKYNNVKQFNPKMKKLVDKPPANFLHDKIVRGDGGDGVPSVLHDDDWLLLEDRPRATPVTVKVIAKFEDYDTLTDEEKRRYDRNKQMISFESIPQEIYDAVIDTYKNANTTKDLGFLMNYFITNRVRDMLDKLQEI